MSSPSIEPGGDTLRAGGGGEDGAAEVVLARYGELWLKGRNRPAFERRLVKNVRAALAAFEGVRVERRHGQLTVVPGGRAGDVARRLQDVFGLSSISPAHGVSPRPEEIARVALEVLGEELEGRPRSGKIPFRVETKRSDKTFPMISTELDRFVADRLFELHGERLTVDLSRPDLTLGIHVRPERVYVFAQRLPGAGGLPVGTLGRAVCLFSGGIDSPVAAWMAMKRGCEVVLASFHSYPYVGAAFQEKVGRLARTLARYQPRTVIHHVPFTEVQEAIKARCPEAYRTVLYRRMMHRIAERIARDADAGAIVTGDSLGQVASQTMENLTCIQDVSTLPLVQPLIAFDKAETIARARKIGTFDVSIEEVQDCCTVFQPTKPILRGRPEVCREAEEELDLEGLVHAAVERAERKVVEPA